MVTLLSTALVFNCMSCHLQGYWEVEMEKKKTLLAFTYPVMREIYVYNGDGKVWDDERECVLGKIAYCSE